MLNQPVLALFLIDKQGATSTILDKFDVVAEDQTLDSCSLRQTFNWLSY